MVIVIDHNPSGLHLSVAVKVELSAITQLHKTCLHAALFIKAVGLALDLCYSVSAGLRCFIGCGVCAAIFKVVPVFFSVIRGCHISPAVHLLSAAAEVAKGIDIAVGEVVTSCRCVIRLIYPASQHSSAVVKDIGLTRDLQLTIIDQLSTGIKVIPVLTPVILSVRQFSPARRHSSGIF